MTRLIFLIGAGLSALSSPAAAANWELVSDHSQNGSVWVDRESLTKAGNKVTLWTKIAYAKPEADGAVTMLSYETIDCGARQYDMQNYIRSDVSGAVIANKPIWFRRWDPIPPDSHLDLVYRAVCA